MRVVLAVALAVGLGALALDMSRAAPRTAGSNHVSPAVFAAVVPARGELCEPLPPLPSDAARAQLLIGTYGPPVPALSLRYLDASGAIVASGQLTAGVPQGVVSVPLHRVAAGSATRACLRVGGSVSKIALGGEAGAINAGSEYVNGKQQPGLVSIVYQRAGSESWWELLPTLAGRFGLGKASVLGDWALLAAALALAAVWVGAVRLLLRELT